MRPWKATPRSIDRRRPEGNAGRKFPVAVKVPLNVKEAQPMLAREFIHCHRRALAGSLLAASIAFPLTAPGAAEPIKIAVFEFELKDVSAGGGAIAQDAVDTEYLKQATDAARRMLADSGRYRIVDTAGVAGDAATTHGIQHCNGCESALADKLGADQSMAGIVTRVTRIVYTVQIVVRDAKTGALVANHFTDGRLGANYAWPRGVKWLMDNRILSAQSAK
jgi:Protein of unknown function (DUF2380)